MASIALHPDFQNFLRLLNSYGVEYLLVGGYAAGYCGYPRATGEMDSWIAVSESKAHKAAMVLREFGIPEAEIPKEMLLERDRIIRMDIAPVMIEVITGASGVDFTECYSRKAVLEIDGIPTNFISLQDLKVNTSKHVLGIKTLKT